MTLSFAYFTLPAVIFAVLVAGTAKVLIVTGDAVDLAGIVTLDTAGFATVGSLLMIPIIIPAGPALPSRVVNTVEATSPFTVAGDRTKLTSPQVKKSKKKPILESWLVYLSAIEGSIEPYIFHCSDIP